MSLIKPSRRGFMLGATATIIALPAIARASSLMKIRGVIMPPAPVAGPFWAPLHYKLIGREPYPITDFDEWLRCAAEQCCARIQNTVLEGDGPGARVSTIFLGVNHSIQTDRPLLFETMIFGGRANGEQRRYATYDEAEAGHAAMVKLAKGEP